MKRTSLTLSILLILFAGCSKHEAMLWVNTFGLTIVIAIGFYGLIYLIDVFIKESEEKDNWYSKKLKDKENTVKELLSEEEEEGILELEKRRRKANKDKQIEFLEREVTLLKKEKGKNKRAMIGGISFVLAFLISLFITGA